MPDDFSSHRLSTAVASASVPSPQQDLGRPIASASEADKIDNLTRAVQRIENRLSATQGLQAPQPAGWQFKEIIWRKNNLYQTFAEEASNGWKPVASDFGAYVAGDTHFRDPCITFCRPLDSKIVREMKAEAAKAAHEEAEKRFAAKREKATRKNWSFGLKKMVDNFRDATVSETDG